MPSAQKTAVTTVVPTYHLTLNQEEAESLLILLDAVAGDPYRSRRGHTSAINSSLRAKVLPSATRRTQQRLSTLEGSVRFINEEGLTLP